jgi:hypothetical protein
MLAETRASFFALIARVAPSRDRDGRRASELRARRSH